MLINCQIFDILAQLEDVKKWKQSIKEKKWNKKLKFWGSITDLAY